MACLVHSPNIFLALQARRVHELDSVEYQEPLVTSVRKELSELSSAPSNHSIIAGVTRSGNPAALTLGSAIHGFARRSSTSMLQISCPATVVNAAIPPLHCPIFSLGGTLVI